MIRNPALVHLNTESRNTNMFEMKGTSKFLLTTMNTVLLEEFSHITAQKVSGT
jgi:hypothetical protein